MAEAWRDGGACKNSLHVDGRSCSCDPCEDNCRDVFTVDEAIEKIGFSRFHARLAVFAGLVFMVDAMEVMVLSFLSPAAKCYFELSDLEVAFISGVVFLGMLVGSQPYGWMMDRYGRRKGLVVGSVFLGVFGLMSAFSPNYAWLLILRFLVGVNLAAVPQSLTYFVEFVPSRHRSKGIAFVAVWWSVGTIFESLLAMAVMPRLGWRYLLGLSTLPVVFSLGLFWFVPESPRYLMVNGQRSRVRQVLECLAKSKGVTLPTGRLVLPEEKEAMHRQAVLAEDALQSEFHDEAVDAVTRNPLPGQATEEVWPLISGRDDEHRSNPFNSTPQAEQPTSSAQPSLELVRADSNVLLIDGDACSEDRFVAQRPSFRDLFSSCVMLRSTLGLWWIWFSLAFVYYGIVLITGHILSLQSSESGTCEVSSSSPGPATCQLTLDQYVQVMWTTVAEIPGLIMAAVLMLFFGRKACFGILMSGVTLCFSLLFVCNFGKRAALFVVFGVRAFVNGAYQVTFLYTPEVYPTRSRALAVACCAASSRIGAMATAFVAEIVLTGSMLHGKIIYTLLSFVTVLVSLQIPIETRHRALD